MTGENLELRIAWEAHVESHRDGAPALDSVVSRYREAHRAYHTERHLTWVVRHVVELSTDHALDDLGATVAAAFYHDAVYDPQRTDNESVSAALASDALTQLGWSADRCGRVAAMIVGTAHHALVPHLDVDTAVLFAADLAVLAAPPAAYDDYVRNVRREYAHVDDDAWRVGRGDVLDSFLARSAIFAPALDLDAWETRARANLTAERRALDR